MPRIVRQPLNKRTAPELPLDDPEQPLDVIEQPDEPEVLEPAPEPAPHTALRRGRPSILPTAPAVEELPQPDPEDEGGYVSETREEAFKRVAKFRAGKTVERMRMLRSLASANYVYDKTQVEKLCGALRKELDTLEALLMTRCKEVEEFDLDL